VHWLKTVDSEQQAMRRQNAITTWSISGVASCGALEHVPHRGLEILCILKMLPTWLC